MSKKSVARTQPATQRKRLDPIAVNGDHFRLLDITDNLVRIADGLRRTAESNAPARDVVGVPTPAQRDAALHRVLTSALGDEADSLRVIATRLGKLAHKAVA
jgi:hypothetical protein